MADTAALEQQDSASTAGDVDAHDVLAETEEESPVAAEEDFSALSAKAHAGSACEVSPATVKESESYWEDLFGPEASDETEEESPEEAEEADNSVAQAETAQHKDGHQRDVEIIEDVAEDLECCAASPLPVQVDDDEDVFGPVTFHPSECVSEPEVRSVCLIFCSFPHGLAGRVCTGARRPLR